MSAEFDRLLDQFERGHIDRRQLLKGLVLVVGGGALVGNAETAEAMDAPLAPAMSISHVHYYVHNIKRSMEFYSTVLGAKPKQSTGPTNQTMTLPGAKPGTGCWLSFTQIDAKTPASINHAGYGVKVPQSQYKALGEELKKRFPDIKPEPRWFISEAAGIELYFVDPDGLSVQIIQQEHNGELTGFNKDTGEKIKK
jgi:catechol 2,3-dioxygenase-like lactoylglutathione lyase family enzyme